MGFDVINWAPVIGSGDQYNIPGSTKLGGVVDSGTPTVILAGDASGFSATPTVAQINASSHWNQVVGAINRRILTYNQAFGVLPTAALPYFSQNQIIKAADWLNMKNAIIAIRQTEGLPAYTWSPIPSAPTAGSKILGGQLADLRRALRISGVMKFIFTNSIIVGNGIPSPNSAVQAQVYQRADKPFGTIDTAFISPAPESISNVNSAAATVLPLCGKIISGSDLQRLRVLLDIPVPDYFAGQAANLSSFSLTSQVQVKNGTFSLGWYTSNSDDYNGIVTGPPWLGNCRAYHTTNLWASILSGSITPGSPFTLSAPTIAFCVLAGHHLSSILATADDVATGGGFITADCNIDVGQAYGSVYGTGLTYMQVDCGG